tara:strand:+ start:510 stop:1259 length:750 start_codon:yes stop_codon:yes gene_type:complete
MKYGKKENLLELAKAVTDLHEFYFSINDENPWSDNEQQNWEDLDELMMLLSSAFQGFGIAFGWNGKELKKGFPDDLAKRQNNRRENAIQIAVCESPESPGFGQNIKENPSSKCNPPYMHEVQKVWNEERAEWVLELTGSSMCTDCLQYDCFEWHDQEPDPDLSKNTASILEDMKTQGFPNGPDWERYDYTTGGDGLENPTEYWTNKKTGISYKVEAEAVISHYAAEVYPNPAKLDKKNKSITKKEKRIF